MKIHNFTVCDQVRIEDNGKFFLIGVYSNGIIFPQLPTQFNLSIWMLVEHEVMGQCTIDFRGGMPDFDVQLFEISGGFDVNDLGSWTPLGFSAPVLIGQPGRIVIEMRENGGAWKEMRTLDVTKGQLPGIATLVPPGAR